MYPTTLHQQGMRGLRPVLRKPPDLAAIRRWWRSLSTATIPTTLSTETTFQESRCDFFFRQTFCSFRIPNYSFKINLDLLSQLAFPSHWRMRLYYQVPSRSRPMERLCHLACRDNSRLDICDIERNPKVWFRQSGLGKWLPCS